MLWRLALALACQRVSLRRMGSRQRRTAYSPEAPVIRASLPRISLSVCIAAYHMHRNTGLKVGTIRTRRTQDGASPVQRRLQISALVWRESETQA